MADFYTASTNPAPNAPATSKTIRDEFTAIANAFGKFPPFTGNANKPLIINAGETGLSVAPNAAVDVATAQTVNGVKTFGSSPVLPAVTVGTDNNTNAASTAFVQLAVTNGMAGNAASATTAGTCTGNAASATTAGTCTGNAATATNAAGGFNVPGALIVNSNNVGAGYLYMKAAGFVQRMIHCNSNIIGFLTSAGAWAFQCDDAGNVTATGNVTAYSDERLKRDWANIAVDFVKQLANVKSGTYTRIDSGERQVGVSAQSLQSLLPEAVIADEKGQLSVAYGNAALAACIELAKEVQGLKERLLEAGIK